MKKFALDLKYELSKKCSKCGEEKPLSSFNKDPNTKKDGKQRGHTSHCRKCRSKSHNDYRNTEHGFLKELYYGLGSRRKCHFTFKEFLAAWEKHRSIYGMRSAWGPGPHNLEAHLPITMYREGKGKLGKKGAGVGAKLIASNLSIDRLDSNIEYTLQNIIFIRSDENRRKNNSSYNDCLIQIRIYQERFITMKAI